MTYYSYNASNGEFQLEWIEDWNTFNTTRWKKSTNTYRKHVMFHEANVDITQSDLLQLKMTEASFSPSQEILNSPRFERPLDWDAYFVPPASANFTFDSSGVTVEIQGGRQKYNVQIAQYTPVDASSAYQLVIQGSTFTGQREITPFVDTGVNF